MIISENQHTNQFRPTDISERRGSQPAKCHWNTLLNKYWSGVAVTSVKCCRKKPSDVRSEGERGFLWTFRAHSLVPVTILSSVVLKSKVAFSWHRYYGSYLLLYIYFRVLVGLCFLLTEDCVYLRAEDVWVNSAVGGFDAQTESSGLFYLHCRDERLWAVNEDEERWFKVMMESSSDHNIYLAACSCLFSCVCKHCEQLDLLYPCVLWQHIPIMAAN